MIKASINTNELLPTCPCTRCVWQVGAYDDDDDDDDDDDQGRRQVKECGVDTHGERGAGVWGQSSQRGPGAGQGVRGHRRRILEMTVGARFPVPFPFPLLLLSALHSRLPIPALPSRPCPPFPLPSLPCLPPFLSFPIPLPLSIPLLLLSSYRVWGSTVSSPSGPSSARPS